MPESIVAVQVVDLKPSMDRMRRLMRVLVKRILKQYGYSPDRADDAVKLVLELAEAFCVGSAKLVP